MYQKNQQMVQKDFFHVIDLCFLNALSAFKTVTGQNMPIATFLLDVIRQIFEKMALI